ncbi:MAG: 3-hydroxybutyrate dehydrogenase [Truepera sp.]|jgi:3-hydroxybutyrate dehydrogenase|nr:3-hydroxybutyrate dehydrogenase [Truepera sp.]
MADRTALVTGGASGIGAACAERLVADGLSVVIADRNEAAAAEVAGRLGCRHVVADLATRAGCAAAVAGTVEAAGALDVAVINAGYQHIDSLADFPEDRWDDMLALMLTGPFLLTKYAWEALKRSGNGRLVYMGSAHSLTASPFKGAYVSAKHGVVGLARVAALEGGQHGITANVVAPAYVRTPLVEAQILDQARTRNIAPQEVEAKVFLENVAVKRLLEPEDVAGLVSYLVSEAAWGVTGSVHSIDLGWTAR